jgi:Cohesin domain
MGKRTGHTAVWSSLVGALALYGATAMAQTPQVVAGSASGAPGSQVSLSVTLNASGAMVAGTQNDLTFDPTNTPINAKSNGKPDCAVNDAINKGGTTFGFLPPGCGGTSGVTCTGVRALVFALDNTDVIPDGSVLYTCNVNIPSTAAGGNYPVTVSGVVLSDSNGNPISGGAGVDGQVTVTGGGQPTTPASAPPTPTPQPTPSGPAVVGPTASASPGDTVSVNFSLFAGGAMVAGTQNDVTFDPANAPINAKSNGKPDCAVNSAINKGGTTFGFLPPGCGGTSGVTCTGVRALVFALDNTDVIPDGSVLYSCNVTVNSGAAGGIYPMSVSGVVLSDMNGNPISGSVGVDGSVYVNSGGVPPTNTPSSQPPTPTPQPTPSGPAVVGPTATASPGETLSVNFSLFAGGAMVAGTQNDVTFDPANAPINAKSNGKPDCAVNSAINKGGTTFGFLPPGCGGTSGVTCTGVRALVFALDNTDVIPDGSVLYSCNVTVSSGAAGGIYPMSVSGVVLSDMNGNPISGAVGVDGSVYVTGPVGPPTNTPTATNTVPTTATPTDTPTSITVIPTATATPTSTPVTPAPPTFTPVPTSAPAPGITDEDGCQIGTGGSAGAGWLLLLPLAGLLFLRRRSR